MSESFGEFEVLGVLNRGGMGEVLRARHRRRGREEALKRLPAHLSRDERFAARFQRECELSMQLTHPHIVPVYDHGVADGQLFMSMQLVEGEDLAHRLRRGPVDSVVAVDITRQVAEALDYAHRKGIEHRDIKPSNIMLVDAQSLSSPPFAFVLDFGIARSAGVSPLTETGTLIGTGAYMAPERSFGNPSDARADIYSLACVLFEMLAGTAPFAAYENGLPAALAVAHATAAIPRPSDLNPAVPKALDAVVAKGMAKDPEHRYRTSLEFADEAWRAAMTTDVRRSEQSTKVLPQDDVPTAADSGSSRGERGRAEGDTLERSHRRSGRRWLPYAVIVAILAAAAGAVGVVLDHGGGSSGSGRSATPLVSRAAARTTVGGTPQTSTSVTATSPGGGVVAGTCLDASSRPVSCDLAHALEVYATGDTCTRDALVRYLGGVSGADTLLPSVVASATSVSGTHVCTLHGPQPGDISGSARNVLASPAGDSWRYCFTLPGDTPTGCNRPHDGEYVYSAPVAAGGSVNCTDKASAYLGVAFDQVSSQLEVRHADAGDVLACALVIRGSGDVLVASVHDLGQNTLPLQPR